MEQTSATTRTRSQIYFSNVLDLVPQSAVKVNDVAVGRVSSVALSGIADDDSGDKSTNGWTAKVTVHRERLWCKLPANARADREADVAARREVRRPRAAARQALVPRPQDRLDVIPITRRPAPAPEVEEVLGALSLLLNGGGLQQIRTITTELNKALDGNDRRAVRDLVGQLNTFVRSARRSEAADHHRRSTNVDHLAQTLNDNKQKIVAALATFPQALEILKKRPDQADDDCSPASRTWVPSRRAADLHREGASTSVQNCSSSALKSLSIRRWSS